MKKYLIIFLLLISPLSVSWMNVTTVGGGVPAAGGSPASGIYRPNGDVSLGSWTDNESGTSNIYTNIDDAVTAPTAGDGNAIHDWETGTVYECAFPEITGTISTVRVHHYSQKGGSAAGSLSFYVSQDGSNWSSEQTSALSGAEVWAWYYVDFSVTWTNTSDLRVRIDADASGNVFAVDTLYIEANP